MTLNLQVGVRFRNLADFLLDLSLFPFSFFITFLELLFALFVLLFSCCMCVYCVFSSFQRKPSTQNRQHFFKSIKICVVTSFFSNYWSPIGIFLRWCWALNSMMLIPIFFPTIFLTIFCLRLRIFWLLCFDPCKSHFLNNFWQFWTPFYFRHFFCTLRFLFWIAGMHAKGALAKISLILIKKCCFVNE